MTLSKLYLRQKEEAKKNMILIDDERKHTHKNKHLKIITPSKETPIGLHKSITFMLFVHTYYIPGEI